MSAAACATPVAPSTDSPISATFSAGASLLGPYWSSRRAASSVLSPCGPHPSVAQISCGVSFQKLFSASS